MTVSRNIVFSAGGLTLVVAFWKGREILEAFGSEFEASPVDGFPRGRFDPFVDLDRDDVGISVELVATIKRLLRSRDGGKIAQEAGVTVSWHELPLLGQTSISAAKAALAAKRQGANTEFHERLLRSAIVTTPEFLQLIANDLGLDYEQLQRDIDSPDIEDELERSKALARIFRLSATPATVVGRTVVIGVVGEARLRSLIEVERQEGPVERCAV